MHGDSSLALTCVLVLLGAGLSAAAVHVDQNAPGPERDGLTWDTAFLTIQGGVEAAKGGGDVWVADGTYTPTGYGGSRSESFHLTSGIAIYGGFQGYQGMPTAETTRDQRDWEAYPTVLSGDLNANDQPDGVNREDNSYHVINATDTTMATIVDGLLPFA